MVFEALTRVQLRQPAHRQNTQWPPNRRRFVSLITALGLPLAAVTTVSASTASPAVGTEVTTTSPTQSTQFGTTLWQGGGASLAQAMQRQVAAYGPLDMARLFYPGMPASWSSITSAVGNTPVAVSFHASPSTILSGRLDGAFRTWFQQAPTTRRTWWTYWHEPEDDAAAGHLNLSQYRAAWSHLANIEHKVGNPMLTSTLVLMTWTLNPYSHRNWQNYYAGSSAIDALGFDGYNYGHKLNQYADPSTFLNRAADLAQKLNKPWGVAELGSVKMGWDSGTARAQWLKDAAAYARLRNARFVSYFDSNVGVDYRLHDTPSSTAWRSIVQSG